MRSILLGAFSIFSLLSLGLAGCRSAKADSNPPPVAPKDAALDPSTTSVAASDAGTDASKRAACEPVKPEPFQTCDTKIVKTPVPEIVDPKGALDSFWDKLASLERGTSKKAIRIGMYGDSNLLHDFFPGEMRRVLQTRYGDAGHGWVSLSRPWLGYHHEDVSHGGYWGPPFTYCAPTTNLCHDKQYGFANMAAETSDVGMKVWAGTTKDKKSVVGQSVSHFELHYLKRPNGGSFTVAIDKKDVKTISTKADAYEAGIETFDVEEGAHELSCTARGDGNVRWFGVSLDRALPPPGAPAEGGALQNKGPGIQIDSLGAGSLNYERLKWVSDGTRKVQLEKRDYDLVILWLGMNVMFLPPNKDYAKEFIAQIRAALPNAAILVMSPNDTVREGEKKSDPRIIAVTKQMKEVADETGVAFWDFRDAMGGDGAMAAFVKRGLAGPDRVHFGPEGSEVMANRFMCAMSTSFASYTASHEEAGCASR